MQHFMCKSSFNLKGVWNEQLCHAEIRDPIFLELYTGNTLTSPEKTQQIILDFRK